MFLVYVSSAVLILKMVQVLCLSARLSCAAVTHLLKVTSASALIHAGKTSRVAQEVDSILKGSSNTHPVRQLVVLGYEPLLDDCDFSLNIAPVPAPYTHAIRHEVGAFIMHSSGEHNGIPNISH